MTRLINKGPLGLLALSFAILFFLNRRAFSQTSCANPPNAIVAENCLPGNPQSEWDAAGAADPTIQGFSTDISVNRGQTVFFKINTPALSYRIDIYRLGYYGSMGARKVATILPSAPLPQAQPACLSDPSTGLTDCGNWGISASWPIPAGAVSGIYLAKLIRTDTGGASHIPFIVRDDSSRSDILFQTSDTTWHAYNAYGGNSLYVGAPAGRAYKVSYNRPFAAVQGDDMVRIMSYEYPTLRWLESNGYDLGYFTGVDSDRLGRLIRSHKVFLSIGHDEYWSKQQREHIEEARDSGVHLAFLSGNEIFWKTRWENSLASPAPYRTMVCYKETTSGKIDPADPPIWTGMWRDKKASPSSDGGRPGNSLAGTFYTVDARRNDTMLVDGAYAGLRFWRNTRVASLPPGSAASFPQLLGYEWDEDIDNGFRPAGLIRMSSSTYSVPRRILETLYKPGTATHHLTLYRHPSGALVFGAGTMQWAWGLDNSHRGGTGPAADRDLQQATVNILADMGAQPFSLQPGLLAASASSDASPPISRITLPSVVQTRAGIPATVVGTAQDFGGGVVAEVEVSTNSGAAWHPAEGRENWSYSWVPDSDGEAQLRSRAVDDSGNLENSATTVANPSGQQAVRVFPNPWRTDRHQGKPVTFDRMAPQGKVMIFTLSGRWVRTINAAGGAAMWDLTDEKGNPVASGYYLYIASDSSGQKNVGNLAVIK